MLNTPFSPWPSFTPEEADAAARVIGSNRVNYWTGEEGRKFEREFAEWTGTRHAVALTNGTVALDLALNGLGIGPGDEVIVTPRTFIASVSAVINAGATPVFADVDRDSGNIAPATIAPLINERTRAIVPVHLAGWPADMDGIMQLVAGTPIRVIEDCAQAHGARIGSRSVGAIGHAGAWSFCQDKIMTTGGEGGMVTTNDDDLWSRMWSYKDHGKSWHKVYEVQHPPGFRWVHDSFGTNWRMIEVQAAIGRIQLRRMGEWTARRTAIAMRLHGALQAFPGAVRAPLPGAGLTHAFYRFYGYVRPEGLKTGWDRDRIVAEFVQRGVPLFQGSCSEVYLEQAFDQTGWRPSTPLPVARELGETSLMFLTHPNLTEAEVNKTCSTIAAVFDQASS
ncbi:DegT/DnrJ/EryC1/StrS aminotransferase family protein [Novosphingobium sp.]|uniref:DegT/DnrJ/EryC1/StrS family aminotransferase n=1 Tax=Novosphingobium sp. TaxID=1874826 RepID=UPI0022C80FAE|nr:DegT/DnrJ/EryC1/StrS aminotransferase family protein [Novosphingobium sp.]MCZ8075258.1 DegT/DnrJ/EryC1/StrS aminotransferase family protein [Roseateles sp.]MCZ8085640.1 DegT/DnrJ/EryC1/StrS aminotransferase family protein [Paracoccaceae bacterium]MCZ8255798.1 DegT/DnrJ/EryC1/StrS aminotransferase family protein [Polaromonas sp.]MCZ8036407.1 DegT/DnrJ/EryC1/StrS aminotransferase family protein [Novosphingobium sp.]MCZ8233476.1 DegT/DnrJ/EryC1/StrS aminotransferase family protein [Novosphingo